MLSNSTVDSSVSVRAVHRGLPGYFRASCYTASCGDAGGYFSVGRTLAASLAHEVPYDLEDDEWHAEVEGLEEIIATRAGDEAVWQWFKSHFPRCMALVPSRRKDRFVAGVRDAYHEEGFGY